MLDLKNLDKIELFQVLMNEVQLQEKTPLQAKSIKRPAKHFSHFYVSNWRGAL